MRKNELTWILVGAFFLGTAVSVHAGRIADRQETQQQRIQQGVENGSLTMGEAKRLERQQKNIQGTQKRALADGRLTPAERVHLESMQDKAGNNIYRAKHNTVERPDAP